MHKRSEIMTAIPDNPREIIILKPKKKLVYEKLLFSIPSK